MLRLPDSYDAKRVKIYNFWTFGPVFKLINHLFKIRQKVFLPNASKILHFLHVWSIGIKSLFGGFWKDGLLDYRPECPEVADFCYFFIITIRYPLMIIYMLTFLPPQSKTNTFYVWGLLGPQRRSLPRQMISGLQEFLRLQQAEAYHVASLWQEMPSHVCNISYQGGKPFQYCVAHSWWPIQRKSKFSNFLLCYLQWFRFVLITAWGSGIENRWLLLKNNYHF